MQVITLLNEKGGVGKTTVATHLATGLALRGNRVIIIDTDPQANTTSALALAKQPEFHDLFIRNKPWKEALRLVHPDVYSPPDTQSIGHLFAVPGNIESKNVASTLPSRDIFRQRFGQIRSAVDFIIIDTSPTPSRLNEDILLASDYVVIPTDCEAFSALEGLPDSIQHVLHARKALRQIGINGANLLGIVPNKFRATTALHRDFYKHLVNEYGDLVWTPISIASVIGEVQAAQQFLYALAPNSRACEQFWEIVTRVEGIKVNG